MLDDEVVDCILQGGSEKLYFGEMIIKNIRIQENASTLHFVFLEKLEVSLPEALESRAHLEI